MRDFGLKHTARALAQTNAGLPLLPGTGTTCRICPAALAAAERIGYPVMLEEHRRRRRHRHAPLRLRRRNCSESFAAVQRLAAGNFRNAGVFLEKFVARARHIEVQMFGDGARRA